MKPHRTSVPTLLTVAQLAERLGTCTRTIRRWISDGKLHAHRFGRQVRVSEDDAAALVAAARR
ncbi:MAG TPA: helix-turn-helix domain-containing protein [Caulobacteraceae bacterium]|jgi:excisionase family DNA binding protein